MKAECTGKTCNWQKPTTAWKDGIDGIHFTDPVQGYCPDNCYLIAALSSIALVQPNSTILNKTPILGKYSITLCDPDNPSDINLQKTYKVTPYQCLDAAGGYPFAHSKTSSAEMWPAILEKAYGAFKSTIPIYSNGTTLDKSPNLYDVPWQPGNGINALKTLTGSSNADSKTPSEIDIVQDLTVTFGYLWGTYVNPRTNKVISSYRVGTKMLAWTYSGSPSPGGYVYNLRIAANHTFTILGMNIEDSGQSYVVLRDPHGGNSELEPLPMWCDYSTGVNGIICVVVSDFINAFETYGWVL